MKFTQHKTSLKMIHNMTMFAKATVTLWRPGCSTPSYQKVASTHQICSKIEKYLQLSRSAQNIISNSLAMILCSFQTKKVKFNFTIT